MFRRFSNAFDTMLTVQQALDAARRSDYFEYHTSNRGAYPFINLLQDGYDIILTAEIPGVKKDDIKVEVENGVLTSFVSPVNERLTILKNPAYIAWNDGT